MTYVFDLGHRHDLGPVEVAALIGGKAANLAVMAGELGLPVPPGFVITTEACRAFLSSGWPPGLDAEIKPQMWRVEEALGRSFGGPANPLLVSVRSGAPVSMPGMMDTVLNLGLNPATVEGLAALYGDRAFAEDCWRRFLHMFGDVVGDGPLPEDPWQQLRAAVEAVFRSWDSERALTYRKREGIADDLGTAVTVQAMVFGNRGGASCTGVVFTRNPSTGEPALYGDVVFGGQGEDVVAGTHLTEGIAALDVRLPAVGLALRAAADLLERRFADLCEIEFTVEEGKLWLLQVRKGKRSPQAALRIAVDMAEAEGFPLSKEQAVRRVAGHLVHPPALWTGEGDAKTLLAKGLAASPGLASGEIVTSREGAEALAATGRPLILVRPETSPEDIPSMSLAAGMITCRGGLTSHAAVIARDWGIPAVIGAPVEFEGERVVIGGSSLALGDTVSIDGSTGEIFAGEVGGHRKVVPEAATLLAWAEEAGIDIAEPVPRDVARGPAPPAGDPSLDDLVHALSIKEGASLASLAAALLSTTERTGQLLAQLQDEGLVKLRGDTAQITEAGRSKGRQLLARDGEQWGRENAAAALESFLDLDPKVKELVTEWQLRVVNGETMPNEHTDAGYDASVLARLASLHDHVVSWLAPLASSFRRLETYGTRLTRALDRASAGEQQFVASARVDSYHCIWFELHEELILLAGRTREQEAAAGRA